MKITSSNFPHFLTFSFILSVQTSAITPKTLLQWQRNNKVPTNQVIFLRESHERLNIQRHQRHLSDHHCTSRRSNQASLAVLQECWATPHTSCPSLLSHPLPSQRMRKDLQHPHHTAHQDCLHLFSKPRFSFFLPLIFRRLFQIIAALPFEISS